LCMYFTYVLWAWVKMLVAHQRDNGMFCTLVCDPQSPEETSATAAIAYGILRGIDLGLLGKDLKPIAAKALDAVMQRIDETGIVLEVSDGTPMGHTLDFYRQIPNVPAPYGQALVMLLLVRVMAEKEG
jgi:unsaturated rhamnogalacturonyl hydrolase